MKLQPYKCPCCDGWGTRLDPSPLNINTAGVDCPSCDDGIVWWIDEHESAAELARRHGFAPAPTPGEIIFGDSGTSATWTCAACGRECSSDGAHHCTHTTYGPVYTT